MPRERLPVICCQLLVTQNIYIKGKVMEPLVHFNDTVILFGSLFETRYELVEI